MRGACDADKAIFQWLSHHFENVAMKLGQFIKEEHAVMCKRNFAGTWIGAAAHQTGMAHGVMRRPKRPLGQQALTRAEQTRHRIQLRHFECFIEQKRR